jgi:site-specific recombinase XerD
VLLAEGLTEYLLSSDYTPQTRAWYESRLGAFLSWLTAQGVTSLEEVSAPHVRRYLDARKTGETRTGKPLSSYTLHGHARAIKAWLNWAGREALVDERLTSRVKLPVREIKVIATWSSDQISRLFAVCETKRDEAILGVLLDTGIRASELCTLTLDRTVLSDEDAYLIVNGKGRKQREVGLGRRARLALARYLHRERGRSDSPYVFLARDGRPLATEGLERMLYRLRDTAGREHFQGVRVSPHTARHTYAVNYLQAGGDLYRLSRLMGHTTVLVTEGYLRSFQQQDARRGVSVLDTMASQRVGTGVTLSERGGRQTTSAHAVHGMVTKGRRDRKGR